MRNFFLLTVIVLQLILQNATAQQKFEECTVGVAAGKATKDGRPLLWKNRDTYAENNEINYFTDGRFDYLGLISAGLPDLIWAGMNEMGFCIMNSTSSDLRGDSKTGPGNGSFMKIALQNCATVEDFADMLVKSNSTGRRTNANFGVIDAFGGAAIFEAGNYSFKRFDTNDKKNAPDGYIVRTNFTMTGGGDGGKIRYQRGKELWAKAAAKNKLNHKHILRNISRDLSDADGNPYSIPLKSDIEGSPAGTINTFATINRPTTVAVALFHGVRQGEHPSLTTFWAVLGEPVFSIAVPCWMISNTVSPELDGEKYSPLCTSVLKIKYSNYLNYGKKKIFLKTDKLKDIWGITYPVEDKIFKMTKKNLDQWRQKYPSANTVSSFHDQMATMAGNAIKKVEDEVFIPVDTLRVAVFADFGAAEICIQEALSALEIDPFVLTRRISGLEIAEGQLQTLDAIVFPGGSGSRQSNSLGDVGRREVIDFVKNGGGFIGICAGAYLGSDYPEYDWCLHLADVHVRDREHYARGEGLVKVKLTGIGKNMLPEFKDKDFFYSYYHDGPMLVPGDNPGIQDYKTLALFESDLHLENDAPAGVMPGSTFLLYGKQGKGGVVLCAGHPESTPGLRWLIPDAVRRALGKERVKYLPYFMDGDKFKKEVFFDESWLKQESILLKKLVAGNKEEKLAAMQKLFSMNSRKFPRWLRGQLRDSDPRVRKLAAELILDSDYLIAENDLKEAMSNEQNPQLKELFKKVLFKLQLN